MKLLKTSFFALITGVIALNTTAYLSANDRATYLEKISAAVHDKSLCEVPTSLGEKITSTLKNDLYRSFKKIEKDAETDDRVLYYLICGDTIKSQNEKIYDDLFGVDKLTRVQKAAPLMRSVVAALKYPKVSCSALGLLGNELGNLSNITKALICQACYKTRLPDRGMFEQLGDWKAIIATCGKSAKDAICDGAYQGKIPTGELRNNLIAACKGR
jgi:hypothetical protein